MFEILKEYIHNPNVIKIIDLFISFLVGAGLVSIIYFIKKLIKIDLNKIRNKNKFFMNKIVIDFKELFNENKDLSIKIYPEFQCYDFNNNFLFGYYIKSAEEIYYLLDLLQHKVLKEREIDKYKKLLTSRVYNTVIRNTNETN